MNEQDEIAKQEPSAGAGKSEQPARELEKGAVKKEAGDPGNKRKFAGPGNNKESWEFDPYHNKENKKQQ